MSIHPGEQLMVLLVVLGVLHLAPLECRSLVLLHSCKAYPIRLCTMTDAAVPPDVVSCNTVSWRTKLSTDRT